MFLKAFKWKKAQTERRLSKSDIVQVFSSSKPKFLWVLVHKLPIHKMQLVFVNLTQIQVVCKKRWKTFSSPMQGQRGLCYCEKVGSFCWVSKWKHMAVLDTVHLLEKHVFGRVSSSIWPFLLMPPVLEGCNHYQLATLLLTQTHLLRGRSHTLRVGGCRYMLG